MKKEVSPIKTWATIVGLCEEPWTYAIDTPFIAEKNFNIHLDNGGVFKIKKGFMLWKEGSDFSFKSFKVREKDDSFLSTFFGDTTEISFDEVLKITI